MCRAGVGSAYQARADGQPAAASEGTAHVAIHRAHLHNVFELARRRLVALPRQKLLHARQRLAVGIDARALDGDGKRSGRDVRGDRLDLVDHKVMYDDCDNEGVYHALREDYAHDPALQMMVFEVRTVETVSTTRH